MVDFLFTLPLPWPTLIGGKMRDEVTCHFEPGDSRVYGNMRVQEFENSGGQATPGLTIQVAIAIHKFSFDYEPGVFTVGVYTRVFEAIARYYVTELVRNHTPPGYPDPVGITWPLTTQVTQYMDQSGSVVPIPRGTFSALRLLPFSEYGTTDVTAPLVRGGAPPH